MLLRADSGKPATSNPLTVEVTIQIETPLTQVLAQARDAAVATDGPEGAKEDDGKLSLLVGMFFPKGQRMFDPRGLEAEFLHSLDDGITADVVAEVQEDEIVVHRTLATDRKVGRRDAGVVVFTPTLGDHLVERLTVVDGDDVDVAKQGDIGRDGFGDSFRDPLLQQEIEIFRLTAVGNDCFPQEATNIDTGFGSSGEHGLLSPK